MKNETILAEAERLTSGDRNKDYGHPLEDFTKTALMWTAILGIKVKPEQIPLCMIAVKISRECNVHKRDNLVDIAGYSKTLAMCHEKRASDALDKIEDPIECQTFAQSTPGAFGGFGL